MCIPREAADVASDLYWIAFLFTSNTETSEAVTTEAIRSTPHRVEKLSLPAVRASLRKRVVASALDTVSGQVAASAQQIPRDARDAPEPNASTESWSSLPKLDSYQIERAVVAIDSFPRCAMLLTIFEGFTVDDAAALLHSDRELVRDGLSRGLRELTRNLAGAARDSGGKAAPPPPEEKGAGGPWLA